MASSVETPTAGFCAPQASPFAAETPMRTPVNEPGPCATAISSTSDRETPAFFKRSSAIGSSVRLCVRPLHCTVCAISAPSRHSATDAAFALDSSAKISMSSLPLPES